MRVEKAKVRMVCDALGCTKSARIVIGNFVKDDIYLCKACATNLINELSLKLNKKGQDND